LCRESYRRGLGVLDALVRQVRGAFFHRESHRRELVRGVWGA